MTPDTPVPVARPENEAAERLAARAKREAWGNWEGIIQFEIPAILATERRLTVERVKARLEGIEGRGFVLFNVLRILDEEANR